MKKITSIFVLVLSCYSCKKQSVFDPNYYVENFRKSKMTDTEVIQAALDSIPENATLQFANREYNIDHTLYLYKSVILKGPSSLKRRDQTIYKLSKAASKGDLQLILDNTDGLKVGDYFFLTNGGNTSMDNSSLNLITDIKGDTVKLYYPNFPLLDSSSDFPAGTNFIKDVKFLWITDRNVNVFPTQKCSFINLTFDGNRQNNTASFSWLINTAIMAQSIGPTNFNNCTFVNSPNETIMGHNCNILNSSFKDLNGSAFHTSMNRQYVASDKIHSYLEGNLFENTNQVATTITGHSEGCITHSDSGGFYTATNNTFINVGTSVLGQLYPSVSIYDWGTSNILFSDNSITTQGRLVYDISVDPGILDSVRIINNKIYELTPLNWEFALIHWGNDVEIENAVNQ